MASTSNFREAHGTVIHSSGPTVYIFDCGDVQGLQEGQTSDIRNPRKVRFTNGQVVALDRDDSGQLIFTGELASRAIGNIVQGPKGELLFKVKAPGNTGFQKDADIPISERQPGRPPKQGPATAGNFAGEACKVEAYNPK